MNDEELSQCKVSKGNDRLTSTADINSTHNVYIHIMVLRIWQLIYISRFDAADVC